jgi:hypothetical protein
MRINEMFGAEETVFGRAVINAVNTSSYKYSLDSNLASVMNTMQTRVLQLGLNDSFTCRENHRQVTSHVTNKTDLEITEETLNSALVSFTEATDIPVVIVVDEMEEVFGKTIPITSILVVIGSVGSIGIAIYLIVKGVKSRKKTGNYSDSDYDHTDYGTRL